MSNRPYTGAYSQRFNNFSATSKNTLSSDSGSTSTGYSLNVTSGEPEMGKAVVEQLNVPVFNSINSASSHEVNNRGGIPANARMKATAKSYNGYRFVQWQTNIDGVGNTTRNPLEFKVTKDTWLIARFERIPAALTKTATLSWDGSMGRVTGNGIVLDDTGRANSGSLSAAQGSTVNITAVPLSGYHFVKWHGAPVDGKTSETVSFQMNNDYNIRAEFAADNQEGNNGGVDGGGNGGGGAIVDDQVETTVNGKSSTVKVMSFVKKWWWAILIVAWIILDEKGGSK